MQNKVLVSLLLVSLTTASSLAAVPPSKTAKIDRTSTEIMDAVVATVDESPITLRDLRSRLNPPRALSLEQASNDAEARAALDRMIFELLVKQEADSRRITAPPSDVDRYIAEVMQRNNLTKEALEAEVAREGKTMERYRAEIATEILQTKLGGAMIQSGGAVTKDEVDAYLKEHPEMLERGARVKLRRILISSTGRDEAAAKELAEKLRAQAAAGENFAELAQKHSDGPEAHDGGSLGELSEKDLSPDIFGAVMRLDKGAVSEVVSGPSGYQIFLLEQRLGSTETDKEAIVADIKKMIGQQKLSAKMESFFGSELFKQHTVDKKI